MSRSHVIIIRMYERNNKEFHWADKSSFLSIFFFSSSVVNRTNTWHIIAHHHHWAVIKSVWRYICTYNVLAITAHSCAKVFVCFVWRIDVRYTDVLFDGETTGISSKHYKGVFKRVLILKYEKYSFVRDVFVVFYYVFVAFLHVWSNKNF